MEVAVAASSYDVAVANENREWGGVGRELV